VLQDGYKECDVDSAVRDRNVPHAGARDPRSTPPLQGKRAVLEMCYIVKKVLKESYKGVSRVLSECTRMV
jgi:hypothetical protein